MTTLATEVVAEPRRGWFRRRGWMLALVVVVAVLVWCVINLRESDNYQERLQECSSCRIVYTYPAWLVNARQSTWFPKNMADWLSIRFRYAHSIEIHFGNDKPSSTEALELIAQHSWPGLQYFQCRSNLLWDGTRLLLPEYCPDLQELCLAEAFIDDIALDRIIKLYPGLTRLDVIKCPIQGKTLAALQQLQKLRLLKLSTTRINDEVLKTLPSLPQLEELHLSMTDINGSTLFEQGVPASLHSLYLEGTKVEFKHLSRLKGHKQVSRLWLDHTPISEDGMELLGTLPSLEQLSLQYTNVTDAGIRQLLPAANLKGLNVSRTAITDAIGKTLRQFPQLHSLSLNQTLVGNACIAALNGYPKLQSISIKDTAINSQALGDLLSLPALVHISIHQDQLSLDAIRQLLARNIKVDPR